MEAEEKANNQRTGLEKQGPSFENENETIIHRLEAD